MRWRRSLSWQAFVAIIVVFAGAVVGMLVASGIGVAVRSRLVARPATIADSLGGAAVNVAAVLIVAWLIGSFMANNGQFPAISRQIGNSAVLKTVDSVMPRSVLYLPVFPQLHSLLSNGVYSQVFSAIGEEASLSVPRSRPDRADVGGCHPGRAEHRQDRGRRQPPASCGSKGRALSSLRTTC